MKLNIKNEFLSSWKLATLGTGVTLVTGAVIKYFNMLFVTGSLVSDIQGSFSGGGLAPYIGTEAVNFLQRLNINLIAIIILWLGWYLLVFAGKLAIGIGAPELVNILGRRGSQILKTYSVLLYGTVIVFGLMFLLAGMFSWTMVVATLVYYLYTAMVIGLFSLNDSVRKWVGK